MRYCGTFFWLRFRYFLYACRLLIFRRWQWLLVLSLLLPGHALLTLASIPGRFLNLIVAENIGLTDRMGILLSALMVACLWIIPQTKALRGYDNRSFFSTEPLSKTLLTTITAGLILFSDSLFMILALGNPDIYRFDTPNLIALKLFVFVLEAVNFVIIQLGVVERHATLIIAPVIAIVPLALSLQKVSSFSTWGFLFINLTIVLSSLLSLSKPITQHNKNKNDARAPVHRNNSLMRNAPPYLRIQIKALTEHFFLLPFIILVSSAILFGTTELLKIFNYDDRTSLTLATGLSVVAMTTGCLYRPLKKSHDHARTFILTVPVKKNYWLFHDIIFVNFLGISIFLAFILPVLIHHHFGFLNFFAFFLYFVSLVSTLRITTMVSQRHSVLIAVCICLIWAALITSFLPAGGGT